MKLVNHSVTITSLALFIYSFSFISFSDYPIVSNGTGDQITHRMSWSSVNDLIKNSNSNLFSSATVGTRIFVDSLAAGSNDGSSWNDAFTSLSVALDSARSCGIDTVLVAKGTYIPTDSLGFVPDSVQRVTFTMTPDMVMLGGFSPLNGVTEIANRDWEMYPTILSGDLYQDDSTFYNDIYELDDRPERDSNAYHIITQLEIQTTINALIDGFYLIGGNANADFQGDEPEFGGALYLESSSLRISNCEFRFNSADQSAGAIFHEDGGSLIVSNCFFRYNWSDFNGGGISSDGDSLIVKHSLFDSNMAEFGGGGVTSQDSFVHIFESTFSNNESGFIGGGLALVTDQETETMDASIKLCVFSNNYSVAGGGLISASPTPGSFLTVDSTVFTGNFADEAGGGMVIFADHTTVSDCEFYENLGYSGGGIHAGLPEIFIGDAKAPDPLKSMPVGPNLILEIENSIFQQDTAVYGGAIASFFHQVKMNQSIVQGNFAFEYGGGIEALNSIYTGTNNLWTGNYADFGGGALSTVFFDELFPVIPFATSNNTNTKFKNKTSRHNRNRKRTSQRDSKSAEFDFNQIGTTKITNSTFSSNLTDGLGGAFNLLDTEDTLTNVIIYGNQDETGINTDSAGLFVEIDFPRQTGTGQAVVTNSIVQGSNGSGIMWDVPNTVDNGGNIDADPIFVGPIDPNLAPHITGIYELQCGSPAIHAGTADTTGLSIGTADLNGDARILGAAIDMGAYEFRKGGPNGNIVYVDSSAISGANNGLSWDDAFLELSDALAYTCLEPGDTIYVARGTYYPDVTGHSDPRDATFELRDSIVLLGGFAPDIGVDSVHERDWDTYLSIASGDIGVKSDSTDNSYSVFLAERLSISPEVSPATIVDGFVIKNGVANGAGVLAERNGGGMVCYEANPTLRNLTFLNNFSISSGGGLYCFDRSIVIDNCHFINNNAGSTGGGMYHRRGVSEIKNSSFIHNYAEFGGGGLDLNADVFVDSDTSIIINTLIKQNETNLFGGGISSFRKHLKVIQSEIIRNNSVLYSSGAFYRELDGSIVFINSLLFGNTGSNGVSDHAIQFGMTADSSIQFINSILWNNGGEGNSARVASGFSSQPFEQKVTIKNSIVEFSRDVNGNWKDEFFGVDLGDNLDLYPKFTDTTNCDFRLLCLSPAIDAGTPDTTGLCLTQLDFIDSSRVVGKFIDIGPYEVQDDCIAIEVSDVAFGEVCDTATIRTFIKNIGVGDLTIDGIVSSNTLFTYDDMVVSFPLVVPYCDSVPLDINYNTVSSGSHFGTLTITSDAVNSNPAIINLSGVTDTTAPVISCVDTTIYLNVIGMVSIDTSYVVDMLSDNCEVDTVFLGQSDFTCADVGTNAVTITIRDIYGNTNTCTSMVTVRDTIPPVAVCQNITVYLDDVGQASIISQDVNGGSADACGISSYAIDSTMFDCTELGNNTVTLTVTDVNGNISTCQATVTVRDTVSPVMNCTDFSLYLDECGWGYLTGADVNNGSRDNCSEPLFELSKEVFGCSDIGDNTVTLTGLDMSENSSSCSSIVTVIDTVRPFAICRNYTAYLDASGMVNISAEDINNNSSDACGIQSVSIDYTDFDCLDIGTNSVILTVTDNNDNVSTCTSLVTVLDTIAPMVSCQSLEITLPLSGMVSITSADLNLVTSDACGIKSITLSKEEFTCSDIGDTEVVITVIDQNDNVSTCTSTISIIANSETFTPEIIGPKGLCDSLINIPYIVPDVEGVSYQWTFVGSGATIQENGKNEVMLDFGDFTGGTLSVDMISGCNDVVGSASFDIVLGGDEFCALAFCLREFAFVSNEVLEVDGSIDVYKVAKRIKSEAEIKFPRSIIFKAGENIELDAPFSVEGGSVFVAEIETCAAAINSILKSEEK